MKKTLVVAVVSVIGLLATCGHASDLSRPEAKKILDKTLAAQPPVDGFSVSIEQMQRLKTVDAAILNKVFTFLTPPPQGRSALEQLAGSLTNSGAASITDGGQRCLPDGSDMRIMTGQFVQCLNILNPADITWQRPGILLRLKTGVKRVIVEITGIADATAPNEKIVEDSWKFDLSSLPKEIEDAIRPATNTTGKALVRLYDDGWRFVNFLE